MSHYFDSVPSTPSARRTVALALPDLTLSLTTDRGVFSAGAVDPGTKLLLLEAPAPTAGPAMDLGCGYGPIAITMARRAPTATVWAVDVNERARTLTAENAAAAAASNVTVVPPSSVPPTLAFEVLYSNPPIRIGAAALHELLSEWVPRAEVSYLVVRKHLGSDSLARWMTAEGWDVARVVSRMGYRILRVTP